MKNALKTVILTTLLGLGISSTANASQCTSNDSRHIAEAIYHEARGESRAGQVAVANVIMNRTKERKISAAKVVQQRGQFSYRTKRNLGFGDKNAYAQACSIALGVMNKSIKDNTGGATYFRSGNGTWGKNFKRTAKIGSHVFFRQLK